MTIQTEREEDGRWIAEVASLPGVMAYGVTENEAVKLVQSLALHVIADKIEHNEMPYITGESFTFARE